MQLTLPNYKILDWSKLKAFADNKINVKFNLGRVENIMAKGENGGGNRHFLLPTMFSKGFLYRVIKSCDFVVKSSDTNEDKK